MRPLRPASLLVVPLLLAALAPRASAQEPVVVTTQMRLPQALGIHDRPQRRWVLHLQAPR